MTPQQLAEELERKVVELAPPVSAPADGNVVTAPDAGLARPGQVTVAPPVQGPTGAATAPSGGLAGGLPFVAGQPAAAPAPAQQAPEVDTAPSSFADMIMQNDAVRLRNQEAFDRREKADRARLTLASITDALASLGNLVGTTQGSFNQPQTYQVPFVQKDVEDARAEARRYADLLMRNDQSLRLAQAREDAQDSAYALRQALEEERTRRAQLNNDARVALAQENARLKGELYEKQHGYRTEEQDQKFADQKQIADDRNRTTLQAAGVRAGATKYAADKRAENSVGGYTKTETETVSRDEYGNVTEKSKTTTKSPNGGPSTTTTTGSASGSGKVKFNVGNDEKKKKGKKANLK